ncbi:MAG: DnaA N-terminal domain-containing protein, partial [Planctomycetota bacterium]
MSSPLSPDFAVIWQAALDELSRDLGEPAVDGWLRGCTLTLLESDRARLAAPTNLHRERILAVYQKPVRKALKVDSLEIET